MKQAFITLFLLCFGITIAEEGRLQAEKSKYPDFSWDKVPLYMHLRKSAAYTEEELNYLAQFPLITLEKSNGNKTYGSTEQGCIAASKAIKAVNPAAKVLYYRNVVINWGGYNKDSEYLKKHPEALLLGKDGKKTFMSNGKSPFFDLSSKPVRDYWLAHATEMARQPSIDGLFMDANIKVLSNFFRGRVGIDKMKEIQTGYFDMMNRLHTSLGKESILLANIVRVRPEEVFKKDAGLNLLKYFDGSYLEGFESKGFGLTAEEYLAKGITAAQTAAREGKIIAMSLGLGKEKMEGKIEGIDDRREKAEANNQARIDYLLSIFLVCAEKYSYLYIHDGYSVNKGKKGYDSSVWLKTFPQYQKKLGKPKGYAKREGYVYTRSFEHVDVWLDIKNKTARLDWKNQ